MYTLEIGLRFVFIYSELKPRSTIDVRTFSKTPNATFTRDVLNMLTTAMQSYHVSRITHGCDKICLHCFGDVSIMYGHTFTYLSCL